MQQKKGKNGAGDMRGDSSNYYFRCIVKRNLEIDSLNFSESNFSFPWISLKSSMVQVGRCCRKATVRFHGA
jgi:hypothetical protein